MRPLPTLIADFLSGKRIAVAGVSRGPGSAANSVFGKLRKSGYEVFPVNPNASEVAGVKCYPDLASIPGNLDGLVIATHPSVAEQVVRQAVARNVRRIWFHRSFGQGSVSAAATQECARARTFATAILPPRIAARSLSLVPPPKALNRTVVLGYTGAFGSTFDREDSCRHSRVAI
jgi:uncharacterized protein